MSDSGPRAAARKDLRDYDNPKGGRNPNYNKPTYLHKILMKYGYVEKKDLRKWVNELKHKKHHKY